jgi:hypothetical protein
MTNFVSIVKYDGGMASYQINSGKDNNYVAQLMNSTGSISVPSEITIEKALMYQPNSITTPLIKKLITAIKMAEAHDDVIN